MRRDRHVFTGICDANDTHPGWRIATQTTRLAAGHAGQLSTGHWLAHRAFERDASFIARYNATVARTSFIAS